jgi:hypothetical protein
MVQVETPPDSQYNTPRDEWGGVRNSSGTTSASDLLMMGCLVFPRGQEMHVLMRLSHAVLTWKSHVHAQQEARVVPFILIYFAKRLSLTIVRAAMYAWQRAALGHGAAQSCITIDKFRALEMLRLRRYFRVLRVRMHLWSSWTVCDKRQRDVMGRIVARMLQRRLSFAMDLWQQHVSAAREWRAEDERRQSVVSRFVRRMLKQAQAVALERWIANVSELARQRSIMDRILRRMLDAKMTAGQTAVGVLAACLSDPCVRP